MRLTSYETTTISSIRRNVSVASVYIQAENQDSGITFDSEDDALSWVLGGHLIWKLRRASPFISAYSNRRVAWKQAEQRVRERKKNVTIYEIDVYASNRRVKYRNVRCLADRLGMDIPARALHHSKHEYVFLGHIPDSAIKVYYKL
ncbi:hypothetical protein COCVIDRAFT_32620 [Bipolaris victoriae FI3]|uniref:DUF7587 domain-containing protein n=1 Tax=Bipolaris victoriae (strain FI3) TaxID=930091 RepID=W7EYI8_BIPV3|nr:hypothetical protein COCVIDRAFT_32620 [Bipolaris victoriae FI3]